MTWTLHHASVLEALREMPEASVDALLADVPYGLGPREPTAEEIANYVLGLDSLDTGGDFMGRKWSVPSVAEWKEILRVLKPGAPVLSFAGSRTQDLVAIGMRAAGFELADTIMWVYAQSMPKPATTTDKFIDWHLGEEREIVGTRTLTGNAAVDTKTKGGTFGIQVGTVPPKEVDVTAPASEAAKRWEGYGHALAPGYEPIILAFKPFDKTIAENVLRHDVGGLAIGACRIGLSSGDDYGRSAANARGTINASPGMAGGGAFAIRERNGDYANDAGRWPKNVLLSHDDKCRPMGRKRVRGSHHTGDLSARYPVARTVLGVSAARAPTTFVDSDGLEEAEEWSCTPSCPVARIDAQSGDCPATLTGRADPNAAHANQGNNHGASTFGGGNSRVYADSGAASRYYQTFAPDRTFYEPKVDRGEREFGCDALPLKSAAECTDRTEGTVGTDRPQSGAGRGSGARNSGPCLKPIRLTRYLATLLLPPRRATAPRRILIPFAGTGSEMIGAIRAGWDEIVGIEREAEYVTIARARLERWETVPAELDEADAIRSANAAAKSAAGTLDLFGRRK